MLPSVRQHQSAGPPKSGADPAVMSSSFAVVHSLKQTEAGPRQHLDIPLKTYNALHMIYSFSYDMLERFLSSDHYCPSPCFEPFRILLVGAYYCINVNE